ncbi:Pectinesterase 3 [Bienertia sinuspersici]
MPKLASFSQLLTNALALNGAILTTTSLNSSHTENGIGDGDGRRLLSSGIPSWMSKADHELVHSTKLTNNANLVVAKDGSGNYKTISDAWPKRFIIYIKAGIYKVNVEVGSKMNNLMLIGNVIDVEAKGNKNVQDGSTTFLSPTFECDIYGTIDLIIGDAAVVIQSCNIYVRKPMNKQHNTVKAQGRSNPNMSTGIVIHNSIIGAALDLNQSKVQYTPS